MAWELERVADPFRAAEGPVWTGDAVRFTEIKGNQVLKYNPGTGETCVCIDSTADAVGLHEGRDGELYACEAEGHRIAALTPGESTSAVVDEFEGTPPNGPSDLEIDYDGDIWFTDSDDKDRGLLGHAPVFRVGRADTDASDSWQLARLTDEVDRPNGILLSPDELRLYVAERTYGPDQETDLRAYPIRGDGSLGPREILHDFDGHRGIDGMTPTELGNIVACAGRKKGGPGSSIYVFSPGGEVLERHPFPENRPTSCTLGGPNCSALCVVDMTDSLCTTETDRSAYVRF